MNRQPPTARIVGTLFIIATVAGVLSVALISSDPATAVAQPARTALGAFLVFAMIMAIALIPAAAFPVLRVHDQGLAAAYVAARGLEAAVLLPAAIGPLLLLQLDAAQLSARTGALLLGYEQWGGSFSTMAFCVGALVLNGLLYRARLVPRVIATWGLAGALLHLLSSVPVIFGVLAPRSALVVALAAPIALNEMVLAGWLLVRGFSAPLPDAADAPPAPALI
jgi:hypothetical protein